MDENSVTYADTKSITPDALLSTQQGERAPEPLLNAKQLAQNLGVTYDHLRGFLDADGMKDALGAVNEPGQGKGARYPAEAEQLLRLLLDQQRVGLVTPKTAPMFLRLSRREEGDGAAKANGQSLVSHTNGASPQIMQHGASLTREKRAAPLGQDALVTAFVAAIERVVERLQPPLEDRLMTRQQAAYLLACAPSSVRRYVKSCRRGRWKRSDLLRYIACLGQPFDE